ncbi:Serine/threonine-protein kinase AfsK [termite gut metagenome]|uniref:Serine/threonine-protein kinase AfsK n=1 Tax=termite gut metagenome TaxID=433724 RepID=A0A5J4S1K6_9ZZZZ
MPYRSLESKIRSLKFLRSLGILSVLITLFSCSSAPERPGGATSWSLFRGDPGLSGCTSIALPDKPALLWSYKSEARTSSSPLVYNQTAYWSDKRGRIYGIDSKGKLCFDYRFETAVEATPMIQDSVLYIGRIDGFMTALSLTTADTLWNFETFGQISASPNMGLFEGKQAVVFGSYDNYLYCLDKENGSELNRFESGYYINGAVALRQDYFISGGCDAWLRIINGTTGQPSDSLELGNYIPASPAIDGEYCYIADHSGNVYEIVIREGKIANSRKMLEATDDSGSLVSVPALSDKTLFVLSDNRYLYAIDRKTSAIRWKYLQKGASGESSPVVCDKKVLSCSKSGIVSILDADNGNLLWEYDTGEPITACPAVIDGRFYILTTKGTLFCFT